MLWGGAALALVLTLALLIRMRRTLLAFVFSAASGLGALGLVNLTGVFTGVLVPCNFLAIAAAVAGGVPGVLSLVALRLLWGG